MPQKSDATNGLPRLLIGTHTFAAAGDSARRQAACIASLRSLQGVDLVNVQFERDPHHVDGVRTLAVLRNTSNSLTGRAGPMKPDVSEILAALASEAVSDGVPLFCFTNADIIFTQAAVDWLTSTPKEAMVLSRQDFDGASGAAVRMELAGTDVFAMTTAWWADNRRRFRRYLLAEGGWDNIYTAVLLCHAHALLENRRPLVRHEIHPAGPMPSPHFGEYIRLLCALDAQYFTRWCLYWDRLVGLRERGATEEEETAWAREAFTWTPSAGERLTQSARNIKAHLRYRLWRWRHSMRSEERARPRKQLLRGLGELRAEQADDRQNHVDRDA